MCLSVSLNEAYGIIMNTFDNLFRILSTGTPAEIKEAKKLIGKKWKTDHKEFGNAFELINKVIETFDLIKSPVNKSAVITGMTMFYLSLADKHFDALKSFIVKNLQNPDGRVRESARKTGNWLYISLTERTDPFIYPKGKELTEKQIVERRIARQQYINFVKELEILIDKYDDDAEADLEYIDEMKPSVYKSIQQMWVSLTSSRAYREIIEKITPVTLEVFDKRKVIERDLARIIKDCKIDKYTDVNDIKQMIFEEDNVKDLSNIIRMFDNGNTSNLNNVLEIISDAWNYFPHMSINGKCPFELYPIKK
ncbi:MAG: hypothetical protein NTV72_03300 [Candidatus Taylorbacteria bacterium]|nr:hypothetical protein [Candidatus Taylorbacteria bacterium]